MAEWYKVILFEHRKRVVPMVFVRFEDLVNDPEPQYEDMMRFFLGITNIKGTNAERRIKQVIEKGAKAT